MLAQSYIGQATLAAKDGKWTAAIEYLDDALAVLPGDPTITNIHKAIEGLAKLADSTDGAQDDQRKALHEDLADIFSSYATLLEGQGKVCDAVFQVSNAISMSVTEELQDRQSELREQCEAQRAATAIGEVGGTILYSSESGGAYTIFRMPIISNTSTTMPSTPMISNGAQPRLSPNGSVLAYHDRVQGGLWAQPVSTGTIAFGSPIRYSADPEDSRDGPPSWNLRSTQLAYSTRFAGQPDRIYITSADADTSAANLGDGKDPAWHPRLDLLAYNGPDQAGQDPGLWTMQSNGTARSRLTDNGNDLRPTWSPDGRYLVFMSKDRGNGDNWELYRYELATRELDLLTDLDPAQDGLPAFSPDGEWVAFMSDRGGQWKLWYVSIEGGPVHFLSDISGQPMAWLEHAIQWVE